MHEPDNATPAPSVDLPRFAVVGHPNKGKSSVVATLAQNDSIAIAMEPGTTRDSHRYPIKVTHIPPTSTKIHIPIYFNKLQILSLLHCPTTSTRIHRKRLRNGDGTVTRFRSMHGQHHR